MLPFKNYAQAKVDCFEVMWVRKHNDTSCVFSLTLHCCQTQYLLEF